MNFHVKILKLWKIIFFLVQMWYEMHFYEFSWKNIETSKDHFFLVQMWYAMHFHEFSWKNFETFKDHFFLSSDVICNALSWIFMKKYWNFQRSFFLVQMWYSMQFHEFSCKNIETFKDHFFLCSDGICNALSWIFMKKFWNFQRSFFS